MKETDKGCGMFTNSFFCEWRKKLSHQATKIVVNKRTPSAHSLFTLSRIYYFCINHVDFSSLSFASIRSNNPMINCSICQLNGALLCRWICIFNRVSHCTALSFFRAAVRTHYTTTFRWFPSSSARLPSTLPRASPIHSFIGRIHVLFHSRFVQSSTITTTRTIHGIPEISRQIRSEGTTHRLFLRFLLRIGMIYLLSHWILNKPSGHATKWSSHYPGNPPFPVSVTLLSSVWLGVHRNPPILA